MILAIAFYNPDGIREAAEDWLGVSLSRSEAEGLANAWKEFHQHPWIVSAGPIMWLKNRLSRQLPRNGEQFREIHFTTVLHVFDIYGTIGEGVPSDEPCGPQLHRPAFFRTMLKPKPIDTTAERVSELKPGRCPHCGRRFNTDIGLELHVEDRVCSNRDSK